VPHRPLTTRDLAHWALDVGPLPALILGVEGLLTVLREAGFLADREEVADAEG
jgi:hypothetical protein